MTQENVERLRGVYSEWAKGDFRSGGELLARDVVFEPMSDGREAYHGRGAVESQMREFLAQWSEFRVEAQDFVEVGEAVLVTERQYGKGKSSGIETDATFYAVWILRDGRVVRVRWETDHAKALEAAGLSEQGARFTLRGLPPPEVEDLLDAGDKVITLAIEHARRSIARR